MFRFRRWLSCATLLCATLGFGLKLGAQPPLTTIQDTLFNSDGSRFNGVVTISWQSFEASDGSEIAASSVRLPIVNGLLYVQLVPTTTAPGGSGFTLTVSAGCPTHLRSLQMEKTWGPGRSPALGASWARVVVVTPRWRVGRS